MPYKGSNAEKLHNMCLYDLLCRMQENMDTSDFVIDCVISLIIGDIANEERRDHCNHVCKDCIAAYLNEEEVKP